MLEFFRILLPAVCVVCFLWGAWHGTVKNYAQIGLQTLAE